jgi:hypothetical protein
LAPECGYGLLEKSILRDPKNTYDLWLNCPEKNVRIQSTQIILHLINTMINHYNLELNEEKLKATEAIFDTLSEAEQHRFKVEVAVIRFLDLSISIIPTEVAKNWLKMGQCIEFWRDFAKSGEAQIKYLYRKEFIAVLIDFYLGERSPLKDFMGVGTKKQNIGNKFTDPECNPLIETIAILVKRMKFPVNQPVNSASFEGLPVYEPSDNDLLSLCSLDFYDRTLKEKYDPVSFGSIIQSMAHENPGFSNNLSYLIVKGLAKPGADEAKSYLEAMTYLLNVKDQYQTKRIEWILGYAQPVVIGSKNGLEAYGLYGQTNLDDLVVNYESPISDEAGVSVINTMLTNRKKSESLAMNCLKQILILAKLSTAMFEYLFTLPPPNYLYAKFIDWIPSFIDYFIAESKRFYYSSSAAKEELAIDVLKNYKEIEERFEQRIASCKAGLTNLGLRTEADVAEEEKDKNNKVFSSFFKPYIIGQTFKQEELDRRQIDQHGKIYLVHLQEYCYITPSKPTGNTNLSLPQSLINDNKLKTMDIPNESPVSFFIQPKLTSYTKFNNSSAHEYHPSHPQTKLIETELFANIKNQIM